MAELECHTQFTARPISQPGTLWLCSCSVKSSEVWDKLGREEGGPTGGEGAEQEASCNQGREPWSYFFFGLEKNVKKEESVYFCCFHFCSFLGPSKKKQYFENVFRSGLSRHQFLLL